MVLFESALTLLLLAIVLLQVSRRMAVPYPTMLAIMGVAVATLPWAPDIGIDPRLALALFIAPALLDAAYDLPPRALLRDWLPLFALAAVAVLLTTAAVAWLGVAVGGLPLAAAIALGAIVAPPDAAAAAAVLSRFDLPRRTITVLKGESLLNDAVALLIFGAAVGVAVEPMGLVDILPGLAFAVPGGVLLGFVIGKIYVRLANYLTGTLGGTVFEFVSTFGAWVIAEHLHVSAVLSVVAFAMTVARYVPERQPARDRVHSYSVWEASVFVLNVFAFLLMGLQARDIIKRLPSNHIWESLDFAGLVLVVVIVVRVAWVLLYNVSLQGIAKARGRKRTSTVRQGILVSWCGMRGLVTLATALALPARFPSRDLIVMSALAVILGTLIAQGLTLGPLIRLLRLEPDDSYGRELAATRIALLDAALEELGDKGGEEAETLRSIYREERKLTDSGEHPHKVSELDHLHRHGIKIKRARLAELRRNGEIEDDVFHALELELDWAELAASPPERIEIIEG